MSIHFWPYLVNGNRPSHFRAFMSIITFLVLFILYLLLNKGRGGTLRPRRNLQSYICFIAGSSPLIFSTVWMPADNLLAFVFLFFFVDSLYYYLVTLSKMNNGRVRLRHVMVFFMRMDVVDQCVFRMRESKFEAVALTFHRFYPFYIWLHVFPLL